MIRGSVNARNEALVRLRLRGPRGAEEVVDAVVDSGFTSSLTLSTSHIRLLELQRASTGIARLADGSVVEYDLYAAEVEWDGVWRPILVSVIGEQPLLGKRLLAGFELRIEVAQNGIVAITPLKQS